MEYDSTQESIASTTIEFELQYVAISFVGVKLLAKLATSS